MNGEPERYCFSGVGFRGVAGEGKQMRVGGDEQDAVGHHRRGIDRRAEVDRAQDLLFPARGEHRQVAVLVPEYTLPSGHQGRAPDVRLEVVRPVDLPGFRVQAMQEPARNPPRTAGRPA